MPVLRRKQSERFAAHVEFAAADVDVAVCRLAKRDDAGVEAMDERAEREKIQRAFFFDVQAVIHIVNFLQMRDCQLKNSASSRQKQ